MPRLPDWMDEKDRQRMISLKRQGLTFDDIVVAFNGKYGRGKIVGEIGRAEAAGELSRNTPLVAPQIPPLLPTVPATPSAPIPQARPIPTPTWVVSIPQPNVTYHHTTQPTTIFTPSPASPAPFNMLEYAATKVIDAAVRRQFTPQVPVSLTSPALVHQMSLQQEQRNREDSDRRERERVESQKKDQAERERKADRDTRLDKLQVGVTEFANELNRDRKAQEIEFGNSLRQIITNDSRMMHEAMRTSKTLILESDRTQNDLQAGYHEAVRNDIVFYHESDKTIERMMAKLDQYQRQQPILQRYSGMSLYQAVRNEVREEILRRQEIQRQQRNKAIMVGLAGSALILAGEFLRTRNATRNAQDGRYQ